MVRSLVVALLVATPAVASAATLSVGSGQTYSTIQGAIDAASDNDVIVVHSGTYNEQLIIDDPAIDTLTIKAYGTDTVSVNAPGTKVIGIIATDVDLKLKGLTLSAPNHSADNGIKMNWGGLGARTLLICGTTDDGHSQLGSTGILCNPGAFSTINVKGYNVALNHFTTNVGQACGYTGGWDENELCSAL